MAVNEVVSEQRVAAMQNWDSVLLSAPRTPGRQTLSLQNSGGRPISLRKNTLPQPSPSPTPNGWTVVGTFHVKSGIEVS